MCCVQWNTTHKVLLLQHFVCGLFAWLPHCKDALRNRSNQEEMVQALHSDIADDYWTSRWSKSGRSWIRMTILDIEGRDRTVWSRSSGPRLPPPFSMVVNNFEDWEDLAMCRAASKIWVTTSAKQSSPGFIRMRLRSTNRLISASFWLIYDMMRMVAYIVADGRGRRGGILRTVLNDTAAVVHCLQSTYTK